MDEHHDSKKPPESAAPSPKAGARGRALPPPAFPPGSRRVSVRQSLERGELTDAFISPDDSIPERPGVPDDAFISPDDAVPHRAPYSETAGDWSEAEDGLVTGMGDDTHLTPEEISMAGDPVLIEIAELAAKLSEDIRRRGEAGLHVHPGMSTFEATLRAYCVGYLRGRHAEDERG